MFTFATSSAAHVRRFCAAIGCVWATVASAAPVVVSWGGAPENFTMDQPLDLDGDGVGDIAFEQTTVSTLDFPISGLSTQLSLIPLNGAGFLNGGAGVDGTAPRALDAGATVPPITALSGAYGYQSGVFWVFSEWANLATGASGSTTPFGSTVTEAFVPFALPAGGDWRYGYLHLDYRGNPADARAAGKTYPTIVGWAYEAQPGVALQVAVGASAIPEPATFAAWIAVVSLGAAACGRRRR